MEFTKTNIFSDILLEAIDTITKVGFFFPSDESLNSLFTTLRTISARDILDEILTSGDIKATYPMYKIRLKILITYERNLKKDSVSFNGHTFNFSDACNRHKDAVIRHYGTEEAANEYFSSVYVLSNMVQMVINDLKIAFNYIEEQVLNKGEQFNRNIDEENLASFFPSSFRGIGKGNFINYFSENLLPDLKKRWTDKDFAKIALIIYESGKLAKNKKPETFAEWYRNFCYVVGCKYHKDYKPTNLRDEIFKGKFSYL